MKQFIAFVFLMLLPAFLTIFVLPWRATLVIYAVVFSGALSWALWSTRIPSEEEA